jgi:transcriptional regulator with XRE-family HTH domain
MVLREHRERLGLSQFDLASKAGVSPHTVAKAERGGALFPSTLRLIADALETSTDALRAGDAVSPKWTEDERRWIQTLLRFYDVYNEASSRNDMAFLRCECSKLLHQDVEWSLAATESSPASGIFRGLSGVMDFYEASLRSYSRHQPYRVDEIHSLGNGRLLAVGVDRIVERQSQIQLTVACSTTVAFRDDRVIAFHISGVILRREENRHL